jgi:hypothetical protein
MSTKMTYIPPQKRYSAQKRSTYASVVPPKAEFPQLAAPKKLEESKMNFKQLFKKVETKRRKRENRMKKGWVKLTKDGMVDSLTTEERESENEWNEYTKTQNNLDHLVNRWDKHTEMRFERDGYLSDYSVDPPSEEEEEEEIEEEEEESDEEDIVETDSKWFTS